MGEIIVFDTLNDREKEQYTNVMEEIKDLQYEIRKMKQNAVVGIKANIINRIKQSGKKKISNEIVPRKRENANYFFNERIAVYTCIWGAYDKIFEPVFVPNNCDFYIITDQMVDEKSQWMKRDISDLDDIKDIKEPQIINRYCKMNPHKIFTEYKYTIYVDGNLRVTTDLTEYVNRISKYGISFFGHDQRKCVYEEIDECIRTHKADPEQLRILEEKLRAEGMPEKYGLLLGSFIVRNHQIEECNLISEAWWNEYEKAPLRDQIVLPYVLFKKEIQPQEVATLGRSYKDAYAFQRCKHMNG